MNTLEWILPAIASTFMPQGREVRQPAGQRVTLEAPPHVQCIIDTHNKDREREREREKERETERDRERQRETARDNERQRETERDR